jgi:hypothetical protein
MARRLTSLVIAVAALGISSPAAAQNWSPEQQEVLRHIDACWAAWEVSFQEWTRVCRPSSNGAYWWATDGAPTMMAETARAYVKPAQMNFTSRRPVAIQVEGDLAIVYFYAMYDFVEGRTRERLRGEQKRAEVFRKVNGQWTFVGGMAAQVPGTT